MFRALAQSEVGKISASQTAEIAKLRRSRDYKSVQIVHIDPDAFLGTVVNVKIGQREIQFKQDFLDTSNLPYETWSGSNPEKGETAIFTFAGAELVGTLQVVEGTFELNFLGDGLGALLEVDTSNFNRLIDRIAPPEEAPSAPMSQTSFPEALGTTAGSTEVRILVAYSARAAAILGSSVDARIREAIGTINDANRTGSVAFTAVLAGTRQVDYNGPLDALSTLSAFRSMSDIKRAHDDTKADLMVMLEDFPDSEEAGESAGINVTAQNAYAVVSTKLMTSYLTFAHEVGHLMGADHPVGDTTQNVFRYGHGTWWWTQPDRNLFSVYCGHTIMSYSVMQSKGGSHPPFDCYADPRLKIWSNPDTHLAIPGTSTVVSWGNAQSSNNAAVLNTTAPIVAKFRNVKLAS